MGDEGNQGMLPAGDASSQAPQHDVSGLCKRATTVWSAQDKLIFIANSEDRFLKNLRMSWAMISQPGWSLYMTYKAPRAY
ncbi:MAG: hypothetical protein BGO90_08840 [Legionella sp. 40-6]|nr:MAG: hypothetical protein BGO90_08840 [Legionella sp. 40-6]